MVYKFCQIIDNLLNINYADDFLDLVALGLIGDMMDLRNFETKYLIEKGLSNIQNPFFKAMIEKQSYVLKNELSPLGVAFYIAPYVNATIRVGSQREKRILFESMLNEKGFQEIESTKRGCKGQKETKVEQSCRNCTNLKNLQKKIRDNILLKTEEKIVNEKLLDNKILIIVFDENDTINKNLTGLIANQLMAKYQRPVLILNKTIYTKKEPSNDWERWLQKNNKQKKDNQVIFEGSGRGYEKSKFKNFKDFLNDSNLILYAEGHQNALGVGILEKNLNKFIEYSNNKLKNVNFNPYYNVDFLYNVNTINKTDILEIADLKHIWGQGIEEPLIMIEGINVPSGSLTLMAKDKHPTLKITLPNGISLIKFGSSEEEYQSLYSNLGCVKINIIGKCEKNIWNGIISPQIMIEDYEVIERAQYYF